jgi:hypothetical protein
MFAAIALHHGEGHIGHHKPGKGSTFKPQSTVSTECMSVLHS